MKPKYIVGIVVIVLALLVGGFKYQGLFQCSTCTGLGDVLSLTQVSFNSNDPAIGGSAWLLNWAQTGNSQYVTGEASANQIQAEGTKAKYGISLSASNTKQTCEYKINSQDKNIQHINLIDKGSFWSTLIKGAAVCQEQCTAYPYFYKPSLSTKCYCIEYTNSAQVGFVELQSLNFEEKFTATINSKSYEGTLSNKNSNSVWLGSNKEIQINWVGNLDSGDVCPQAEGQGVYALYQGGAWKLGDRLAVDKYFSNSLSDITRLRSCAESSAMETCVNAHNNYEALALQSKEFVSIGGSKATTSGSLSTGKVFINLAKLIKFPSFTARIKADLLGVVVPVSQPKIVSSDSECFTTGDNGFIVADIKNVGDVTSSFNIYADCPLPFSQTGGAIKQSFAKGETKTINIPITGVTDKKQTESCKIIVEDANNPSKRDTASQNVCVESIILCDAGTERCNGAVKEKCIGSGWQVIPSDNSCLGGGDVVIGSCSWKTPSCWSIAQIIGMIVAFIVFIISWVVNYTALFDDVIKNEYARLAVSLILGLALGALVGYLVFRVFWWAVALGVVLIVGNFLIGRFTK